VSVARLPQFGVFRFDGLLHDGARHDIGDEDTHQPVVKRGHRFSDAFFLLLSSKTLPLVTKFHLDCLLHSEATQDLRNLFRPRSATVVAIVVAVAHPFS